MKDPQDPQAVTTDEPEAGARRSKLEHRAGQIAQIFSLTEEMAREAGGAPDYGDCNDLFELAKELHTTPENHRPIFASRLRERPEDWDGERCVPALRSRLQFLAAAGIAAEIYDLAIHLDLDSCLEANRISGPIGELATSLQDDALALLVHLGHFLRQPGDVLRVGVRELSSWEIEWWTEDRDRERKESARQGHGGLRVVE